MASATAKRALIFLCSANVLLLYTTAQLEVAGVTECQSFNQTSIETLSTNLKEAAQCVENLTPKQTSALLDSLKTLRNILKTRQKTACPRPVVQRHGGLVCGSIDKTVYCKPMCNEGYDFGFLRRSRLYEECGAHTKHKWTTQYIGGNRLAVCQESHHPVAGAATAYFPKDQNCLETENNDTLKTAIFQQFTIEMKNQGQPEDTFLYCG